MDKAERFRRLTCTDEVRRDLRERSLKAAAFTGGAAAGDFVIRLGSNAILARLIIPEHFGLVMMVMAVTAIAEQLRELGLSAATVQKKEITHQEVTNLFWLNLLAGLFIGAAVCATSPLIAKYYGDGRLTIITCLMASNFLFGGLMVQHQALLTRQLKLGRTSMVRLGTSIASTLVAIVLAWMGYGYWALVWREVSRSIFLTVGMWLCLPWIPGMPYRSTNIRSMIGFGTNLTIANILGSVSASMDRFLVGRIWGAGPVAIYRQAYQLMVAPTDQLLSPIYQVAQPGLSMLQSDEGRFRRYYQKVLTAVCLATMPLSLFVAVNSVEITWLFLGPQWSECAPILTILSLGTFIKQAVGSSAFILVCRGRSGTYLALTLVNNAFFLLAMVIGVRWGIVGIAVADVATTWLMIIPRLYFSLKNSPVSVRAFLGTLFCPTSATVLMAIALVFFRLIADGLSTIPRLLMAIVVAISTFFVSWILLPGGRHQLKVMFSDCRSILATRSGRGKPVEIAALP